MVRAVEWNLKYLCLNTSYMYVDLSFVFEIMYTGLTLIEINTLTVDLVFIYNTGLPAKGE